ncbi:energy-coupling factor transporter ATPase [Clostridium sp. HCP1S3_B4]|uniref:energy-coupling factor transporter ATPase n=1 Tax=unclassified Clostridium TaxID=2614128 RepID=UPI0016AB61F9|nr:energy-coupling factor transporter ATPase [Clostridium sp.]NLK22730.1 energy-coupling factor transporter ATPase [Clostridiales bacterium]
MDNNMVTINNLSYTYTTNSQDSNDEVSVTNTDGYFNKNEYVVNDISFNVKQGEFIALLGHNGSGKSTIAKLINALLLPTDGTVIVNNIDTKNEDKLWDIRSTAGMVFQNPDNQLVATIVEEDVAFGPENLGVPSDEIRKRVDDSLKKVGMYEYKRYAPHLLSGGQKQRIAIAGVLAMNPKCIIFDEPTAMLDPSGRKEVMDTINDLNKNYGITIILITHYMDEAAEADRILVIDDGNIFMDGTPRKVFSQVELVKKLGLDVPQVTELAYELRKSGVNITNEILNVNEMVNAICQLR